MTDGRGAGGYWMQNLVKSLITTMLAVLYTWTLEIKVHTNNLLSLD